jgi:hypothetical protein
MGNTLWAERFKCLLGELGIVQHAMMRCLVVYQILHRNEFAAAIADNLVVIGEAHG